MSKTLLNLWVLLLALTFAIGGCSDSPTSSDDPGGRESVASLELEMPAPIVAGREFELRVVAVGSKGTRPFSDFAGTVDLAVSDGSVSPSSVDVVDGEGTGIVVVQTTASSVEFSAVHSSASGSVDVQCAKSGAVLVKTGRFFVYAGASARTFSDDSVQEQEESAPIPGNMDFSRSVSAEAEAIHFFDVTGETHVATGSAEASLTATSQLAAPDRLVSMSIDASAAASASFNASVGQGSGGSGVLVLVEFDFEVEEASVLCEFFAEVEEGSYFVKNSAGENVIHHFGERSATLAPGDYSFRAKLDVGAGSTGGSAPTAESTGSLSGTLSFIEVPAEE